MIRYENISIPVESKRNIQDILANMIQVMLK